MDLATPVSTEELAGERRALAKMHREFDAAPGRSGLARYFPGPCPLHGCHAYRPMMPGPCHQTRHLMRIRAVSGSRALVRQL